MHLLHVVGTISLQSSGPSRSVPALCVALARRGHQVELAYVDYGSRPEVPGVRSHVYNLSRWPGLRFATWSTGLLRYLLTADLRGVLLHVHGLWHFPTIYPAWAHALKGVPLVCSPRGTLGAWPLSRSPARKRVSLALGQGYALREAAFLHATSQEEAADFRAYGLANPIVVAPNVVPSEGPVDLESRRPPTVLFLSRLHPKKNVEALLGAWPFVKAAVPDAKLLIAGSSELGYREKLEQLVASSALPDVRFVGELLGEPKAAALREAQVFAFPSHNENFGMVVAEAMAAGALVVTSTGTPWSVLEERSLGRQVAPTAEAFGPAIVQQLTLAPELAVERRRRAAEYVLERFGDAAAEPLERAYEQVLRGEPVRG